MFLRTDSTSQPAAAGSHQAACTAHTHTHTQTSTISMVISREAECISARVREKKEEGRGVFSLVLGLWFNWLR